MSCIRQNVIALVVTCESRVAWRNCKAELWTWNVSGYRRIVKCEWLVGDRKGDTLIPKPCKGAIWFDPSVYQRSPCASPAPATEPESPTLLSVVSSFISSFKPVVTCIFSRICGDSYSNLCSVGKCPGAWHRHRSGRSIDHGESSEQQSDNVSRDEAAVMGY